MSTKIDTLSNRSSVHIDASEVRKGQEEGLTYVYDGFNGPENYKYEQYNRLIAKVNEHKKDKRKKKVPKIDPVEIVYGEKHTQRRKQLKAFNRELKVRSSASPSLKNINLSSTLPKSLKGSLHDVTGNQSVSFELNEGTANIHADNESFVSEIDIEALKDYAQLEKNNQEEAMKVDEKLFYCRKK